MQTENPTLDLDKVDEAVSGNIVDAGPDHLTVHDIGAGEDLTLRIDDRTTYGWTDSRYRGQLTDAAQVRVGFYIAGGVHTAAEIIVMDPGQGESIAAEVLPSQYQ
ncbi:hypothetical protein HUA74_03695 [Myxococcus sp. CA051A]|uniref:Uncharacterized protein n=1 Tax=Myxococcus llanfairpwllgwyngyllgogerychwyrndrobwllllantysiliogogogochensis TaxID=2590453 RepID=A0A540WU71_9BACT|nr:MULTISPECIES: hypothetical protein [Myxococcus]NTX01131.1 hypothetical protein [Myxococcus sp. CA040A]NTX12163.1 hypothetical protein [Myxococcus sp. CA056]NTX33177.1 hypothetical protein [Myxococcus sp. CA033]NTX54418.1 hypothetical protein [Myxococcus sp. CA039A]NTX59757.1 hypothetical protein [Myxococcus sp. CA051A]